MFAQKEALVKLLRDGDPETIRLIKAQLLSAGAESMADLTDLASVSDTIVSAHARAMMAEIREQSSFEEFSLLCHFFGERVNLEHATWALSRAIEPGLCTKASEHKVNAWGRQFAVKISGAVSNRERVLLLADYMADELEFRGNSENYYSERNSLLPRVMETRVGIPITLTLLYMMIGARAGMVVDGINLPGHFIARHGEVFFDPFQRGRILSQIDIEKILTRQGLQLKNCHLQAASPRQVLVRMLANLLYVYDLHCECEKHEHVQSWMNALMAGSAAG